MSQKSPTAKCVDSIIMARAAGAPYVAVATPDPINLMKEVSRAAELRWPVDDGDIAIFSFDLFQGLDFLNKSAQNNKDVIEGKATGPKPVRLVTEMLRLTKFMPVGSLVFFLNFHKVLDKAEVISAFQQMRDVMESRQITMIGMAPNTNSIPLELRGDFLMYREKLPTPRQLRAMIDEIIHSLETQHETTFNASNDDRERAVNAINGLPMFVARNIFSMSVLDGENIDFSILNERKEEMIRGIQGLRIHNDTMTFDDIGGHENAKRIFRAVLTGQGANGDLVATRRVRLVVVWEEIEKMFGNVMGANDSGVSKRMLGRLLTWMVQNKTVSFLLSGVTGAGKSLVAQAACNEAGVPMLFAEMGSAMSSLVGSSEGNLNAMLDTFEALGTGDDGAEEGAIIFVATSNDPESLPPELLRRFENFKIFFQEPQTREELDSIWKIFLAKYNLTESELPDDLGWTGDEIRRCCFNSSFMGISLKQAAADIIPVTVSHAAAIDAMKRAADKKYLSSSTPGTFVYGSHATETKPAEGRKISTKRTLNTHPNAPE